MKFVVQFIICLLHNLTRNLKVCHSVHYRTCIQSAILFFLEFAEADTFFCFSHIMVEIGDKFNKALDSSPTGYSKHKTELWLFIILYCAESALNTMMKLLKRKDAVLYENLVEAAVAYA